MRPLQMRLGEIAVVLIYFGLIFTAVRAMVPTTVTEPEFWSKLGVVTLGAAILGLLCTSIPAICIRRGPARAFWIGFASFGWAFFLFGYGYYLAGRTHGRGVWIVTGGPGPQFSGDEPLWFTLLCTPLFAHIGGRIGKAMAGDGSPEETEVSRSGR
jgi:hypothetical protein